MSTTSQQESGRRGGKIGGKAKVPKGFSKLSKKQLSANGRAAARKRWAARKVISV